MTCETCIHDYQCARYTTGLSPNHVLRDGRWFGTIMPHATLDAAIAALNAADTSEPDCKNCAHVFEEKQRYTVCYDEDANDWDVYEDGRYLCTAPSKSEAQRIADLLNAAERGTRPPSEVLASTAFRCLEDGDLALHAQADLAAAIRRELR